jgi:hypothetical protein
MYAQILRGNNFNFLQKPQRCKALRFFFEKKIDRHTP